MTVADVVASSEIAEQSRLALGLAPDAELQVWRSMVWWSYPGLASAISIRQLTACVTVGDSGLPFHFDAYDTVLQGGQDSLTAYIAITPVTDRNGMRALRTSTPDMFRGAHPDIYGNALLQVPRNVEAAAEPAVLSPGQFVLFDGKCVHSSITNQDPAGSDPRVALALRIIPSSTVVHQHAFQPSQATVPLGETGPCHTPPTTQQAVTHNDHESVGPASGLYNALLLTVPSNPAMV